MMPRDREDELLDQRHSEVIKAISGVHERLDVLNGRTRKVETDMAVLKWAIGGVTSAFSGLFAWLFKG